MAHQPDWGDIVREQGERSRAHAAARGEEMERLLPEKLLELETWDDETLLTYYDGIPRGSMMSNTTKEIECWAAVRRRCRELISERMAEGRS